MRGAGVRGRLAAVAVAATVAAVAGIAGTAPAETTIAGKFRYVQRTFTVPGLSQSAQQVARCPGRTHVYGGGTTNQQSFGGGVVTASYPVDLGDRGRVPDDGWAVRYDNYRPTPASAVVTAICGRATPKYRSAAKRVGAGRFLTLTVRCPGGTYVWGGGGINRAPYNTTHLSQSLPSSARAWTSTMANFSAGAHGGATYVICGTRKPRYVRDSTTVIPEASALWDADCPNQRFHLISGGASHAAPGQIGLNTLNPADADRADAAPDDEMTASFHNYTNSSHRVTVHAVCLR
jgi:hypothetical protein